MKHKVTAQDLIEWRYDQEIVFASAFGNGVKKKLTCDFYGYFQVYDHGVLELETKDADDAIDRYNSI